MKTPVAFAIALLAASIVAPVSAGPNDPPPGAAAQRRAAPGDLGMATMSAVVAANGTLVRGEGVTASDQLGDIGEYQVNFGRDVTACTYVASTGLTGTSGTPAAAYAAVTGRIEVPSALFVRTFDGRGDNTPFAFHLVVFCGR